jgi:tripeptide aminopeptidase
MAFDSYDYTVKDRFLRYVTIDTQSDPFSDASPSTEKQKDLGQLLVAELLEMGVTDAEMDGYGYVYATLEATTDKQVPVICLCAHMDTSPDCSGRDVRPLVHENYAGGEIVLPDDRTQRLSPARHPELARQLSSDIITASGTTLLGADNKAGVAEIMDAARYLVRQPEIRHGKIRILFTPDEEIGRGTRHVDLEKLGARFGYTMDGETAGSFENENFSADKAVIEIMGVSAHTGMAKGVMVNAVKVAAAIIEMLPADSLSPETTSEREGFLHPLYVTGSGEKARIEFLVRDFTEEGLAVLEGKLKGWMETATARFPGASATLEVVRQYRNMAEKLKAYPQVSEYALEAIRRVGLTPSVHPIRGGTDGAMLTFMGLPCPNIFAGEHAFHSRQEWVSVQDMQKAVQVIVALVRIWEEKS